MRHNIISGVLLVKCVIDRQKIVHQVLKQHISDKIKRAIEWDQQSKPEYNIFIHKFKQKHLKIIYNIYIRIIIISYLAVNQSFKF